MKKIIFVLMALLALQACGSEWSRQRGVDQAADYNRIAPSFAHPAGSTMDTD